MKKKDKLPVKVKITKKKSFKTNWLILLVLVITIPIFFLALEEKQNTQNLAASNAKCIGIKIPAYYGFGADWDTTVAGAPAVKVMIVNISNGPGSGTDATAQAEINKAKAAGIRVMGYVATGFGNNDPTSIKAEIAAWKSQYGVVDIHLDEAWADDSKIPYYQDLTSYINANGGLSELGIGDIPSEAWTKAGDILNIFEHDEATLQGWQAASWIANYPPTKFSASVYSAQTANIQSDINKINQSGVGYFVLTDSSNPWSEFSSSGFWNAEIAAIKATCNTGTATTQPSGAPSANPSIVPSFVCGGSSTNICATTAPTLTLAPSQGINNPTTSSMPFTNTSQTPQPTLATSNTPSSQPKPNGTIPSDLLGIIKWIFQELEKLINGILNGNHSSHHHNKHKNKD